MCFSPEASFISSGALALIGVASLKVAKKKHRLVAAIPLFFAVQQFLEGIQWLAIRPSMVSTVAGYGYLFFAFILWPTYIPWVTSIIDPKKKKVLRKLTIIGGLVSAYLLLMMVLQPLSITLYKGCINYSYLPPLWPVVASAYLTAVCGSLMSSSIKKVQLFGGIAFASAVVAGVFFFTTFVSVWCFFAAIISGLVYFFLRDGK